MDGHLGFVVAAYAITAFLLIATAAWIWTDYRAQRRMLAEADRVSGRRRHDQ